MPRRSAITRLLLLFLLAYLATSLVLIVGCYLIPPPFSPGRLPNLGQRQIINNSSPLREKWEYKTDGLVRAISANSDSVYVWYDTSIAALNAGTGQEEWKRPAYSGLGLLTAVDQSSVAFYPSDSPGERSLSVLSAASGEVRWEKGLSQPYSLAMMNGLLYVGMRKVAAFNLDTGNIVWALGHELPEHTIINVLPDSRRLYVIAEKQAYLLDPRDGTEITSFPFLSTTAQIVLGDKIFGVSRQFVSAADAESGRIIWTNNASAYGLKPTVVATSLYVVTTGLMSELELTALDTDTGERKWTSGTVLRPFSAIVEFKGLGYVISDTGRLYAFDLSTGKAIGSIDTGAGLPFDFGHDYRPSLVVAGETLVSSFEDSPVYGFDNALSQ